mmetsp:Transcript_7760/g.6861  ORF Transcript_7760/g.6861 Transcript_7760/m.6861 type:complete len:87 (-) Transcript_7760:187-447(-)
MIIQIQSFESLIEEMESMQGLRNEMMITLITKTDVREAEVELRKDGSELKVLRKEYLYVFFDLLATIKTIQKIQQNECLIVQILQV